MNYRVQAWDMTGTGFGPGALIAEFEDAVNLGYADYINDVGEAFFTLSQDDTKVSLLRSHRYNAHIRIYRDTDLVWAGFMGEWDANERDVIFYAYSYAGLLYLYLTDWNVAYTNAQVDTIVSDAWTRAKTTLSSSLVGWVTTGTIQAPVTTSGGATAIVLPSYRLFYKRILFLLKELAALSIGQTTNVVQFEITPAGVFNFWKNAGSDLDVTWSYGGRGVKGFYDSSVPFLLRNDLYGVGINPNDVTLRDTAENAASITARGRRQEPIFFPWVRDSLEIDRVLGRRLQLALREDVEVGIEFYPDQMIPPRATGATWGIADRVNVKVDRGITSIDGQRLVSGYQVIYIRGAERVRALIQERPGT